MIGYGMVLLKMSNWLYRWILKSLCLMIGHDLRCLCIEHKTVSYNANVATVSKMSFAEQELVGVLDCYEHAGTHQEVHHCMV